MKKLIALTLAIALVFSFAACGKTEEPTATTSETTTSEPVEITIAASPTPHAEILKVAAENLPEGFTLKILEYTDYVQPNMVVDSGEVFANYFQHVPYLDDFNSEKGTHIVSVCGVHVEPMAIYAGKSNDLANIVDGAKIAVPNDTTNEARALLLLEANGIIELDPNAGITATKKNITKNPYNVELFEVEAAQVPNVRQDVDFAVINVNYALEAGLNPVKDSLAIEDSASAYVNIVCVKEGNENDPRTAALVEACQSQAVKEYIEATYDGAVVCVF